MLLDNGSETLAGGMAYEGGLPAWFRAGGGFAE